MLPDSDASASLAPYDVVVVQSFGGPEAPEEVMPFLRRVTAGRGVPDERLAEVAEHYHHFGGASPINAQNRALVAALTDEFARRGVAIPVRLANRNSPPFVRDVLADLGNARALVLITSLYQSYSSCRQYREDLGMGGTGLPVRVDKVPAYGAHPGVRSAYGRLVAETAAAALAEAPGARLALVSVAHSIPDRADAAAGRPAEGGHAYSRGVRALAEAVAAAAADRTGQVWPVDVAWCSRSGPPSQPWLEPDILDRLDALAADGVDGVVLAPIGFVSDHMEVAYDLDTEAVDKAAELGIRLWRAPTLGTDAEFVAALADLALARAALARGGDSGAGFRELPTPDCPPDCCRSLSPFRPTRCATEEAPMPTDAPPTDQPVPDGDPASPGTADTSAGPPPATPERRAAPAPAELDALQAIALHVATEVALLIGSRHQSAVTATKSSATDVVTEMDRRAQELALSLLRRARPDDGFLGEEDGNAAGTSGITWVVDPIDGTVNYVYDIPAFCVSVAAVTGDPQTPGAWNPVAGAVVNPVTGERFWARRGGGAHRQRGRLAPHPIRASAQPDLALSLVGTGFGYAAEVRSWQARLLTHVLPRVRDIRRFGSAALDLCHVADGTLDAYYERGLNPWDVAAGWVIAAEAGAAVTGLGRDHPEAAMTVAGGACHPALVGVLTEARAAVGDV